MLLFSTVIWINNMHKKTQWINITIIIIIIIYYLTCCLRVKPTRVHFVIPTCLHLLLVCVQYIETSKRFHLTLSYWDDLEHYFNALYIISF